MEVVGIKPRGYCKGVIRAINIAKETASYPKPVYILGMIVHNQYIVQALEALGLHSIDEPNKTRLELLDKIDHGTVVITAHGASDEVFTKAKDKGLNIIDASCLDVIKTHELIKHKISEGYEILYIGKKGHPEAEGAISNNPYVHLITCKEDIDHLDPSKKYCLTNQTTMSLYDVYDLCEYAKEKLKQVNVEKETCTATKVRQTAIKEMDQDIDIVYIVGDPHSNNTQKLAQIAKSGHTRDVYMIESVRDIDIQNLKGKKKAGVSSGASTPTYLTNQVIEFLKQFDYNNPATLTLPEIDYSKILS